jgi:hypothetical protein
MSCGRPKGVCSGSLRHRITVERRALLSALPGSAEVRHDYTTVLSAKAEIKTKQGTSLYNSVEINGKKVSHVITIRYTSTAFDIRDRVRDGSGNLYAILSIEDVDNYHDWMRLYCALQGAETREAAA